MCVCVFVGVKREGGKSMGERDVVTQMGGERGGLISVIKAKAGHHRGHTPARHGLTNHSVPHHVFFYSFIYIFRVSIRGFPYLLPLTIGSVY